MRASALRDVRPDRVPDRLPRRAGELEGAAVLRREHPLVHAHDRGRLLLLGPAAPAQGRVLSHLAKHGGRVSGHKTFEYDKKNPGMN